MTVSLAMLVLNATHANVRAEEGLVGVWNCNEGKGTVAADNSGGHRHQSILWH